MVNYGIVVVLDCDGVLTDGSFYSTHKGKLLKKFGADDWDALKLLKKYIELQFITADKKGFKIMSRRICDEMKFDLSLVSNKPKERWEWIRNTYPKKAIIYIGDGIFDWYCLRNAYYSITTSDALSHVIAEANCVIKRKGGDRFVAEACIHIMKHFYLCDIDRLGIDE